MKILVDIAGCDDGFLVPINACINLVDKIKYDIILVGKKEDIIDSFKKNNNERMLDKFEILECKEYISNNEEPAFAIKNKKDSNLVVAFNYMKENDDVLFISASSTGGLMAGSLLKIGRIKGIHRPALITLLPTLNKNKVVFLDSGANPECKQVSFMQYAKLGMIYAKSILNIDNPRLGLLNIGEEEEKGTPILKDVYKQFKVEYPSNFVGNIEARYILKDKADVIVCDGLMGNIALKSLEGTASTIKHVIINKCKENFINMAKAVVIKDLFKEALKDFDYKLQGGAILLGVKKPVIKVHGSSNVKTYEIALKQAEKILEENIIKKIEEEIKK